MLHLSVHPFEAAITLESFSNGYRSLLGTSELFLHVRMFILFLFFIRWTLNVHGVDLAFAVNAPGAWVFFFLLLIYFCLSAIFFFEIGLSFCRMTQRLASSACYIDRERLSQTAFRIMLFQRDGSGSV